MPSPAWAGRVLTTLLAQREGREGSQHPSEGSRDRDGDRDRQGVQLGCRGPGGCSQQAWSHCLSLMRSSAEDVVHT